MPQESSKNEPWTKRKHVRAFVGCFLGAALIVAGGVGAAHAGDSNAPAAADDEDNMPDVQFLRGVLKGMGLKKPGDDATIDYHERSPLVVPPSRDLPPPEADSGPKSTAAGWPSDPDVNRRKAAVAADHKVSSVDESRALRPNEMMPNGTDVKGKAQTYVSTDPANGAPMKPSQLGFNGWSFNDLFGSKPDTTTFKSEPARNSLTEPPVGYRTPAPDQPYGVGKDKNSAEAYDFWNKHGTE
jgi:hypothetical protein